MKAVFVGGRYDGRVMTMAELRKVGNGKLTPNYTIERACHRSVPRAELDDQPKVDGYLGPMWGGDHLLYETQEVYDGYSVE